MMGSVMAGARQHVSPAIPHMEVARHLDPDDMSSTANIAAAANAGRLQQSDGRPAVGASTYAQAALTGMSSTAFGLFRYGVHLDVRTKSFMLFYRIAGSSEAPNIVDDLPTRGTFVLAAG